MSFCTERSFVTHLGGFKREILRDAQNDKKSLLIAILYVNSSVGRASAQWGGRPRPPTDMAAGTAAPPTQSLTAPPSAAIRGLLEKSPRPVYN
jgi:hypothetical protein